MSDVSSPGPPAPSSHAASTVRAGQQHSARLGERNSPRQTFKQRDPQPVLQRAQLLGQRRLGHEQPLRAGDAAILRHGEEHAHGFAAPSGDSRAQAAGAAQVQVHGQLNGPTSVRTGREEALLPGGG